MPPQPETPPPPLKVETTQDVQAQFQDILRRIAESDEDPYRFEDFRDEINALSPAMMPAVMQAATHNPPPSEYLLDLFTTTLADNGYPPALPYFVHEWLEHSNDEVRFAAICVLEARTGGEFGLGEMIKQGWADPQQLKPLLPRLRRWWERTGQNNLPGTQEWYETQRNKPTYTPQEKRYNFIAMNPLWVMQGDGVVHQPAVGERLPRQKGVHVVGGQMQLEGEMNQETAVFELDSDLIAIVGAYKQVNGRWHNVTPQLVWAKPAFLFN